MSHLSAFGYYTIQETFPDAEINEIDVMGAHALSNHYNFPNGVFVHAAYCVPHHLSMVQK
ncbi:unnamed protein product, partial [Ilex paraguariensis]